ncbi:MAG: hypothetical protein JW982_02700 [Spirochaetes bacterium]|nr:hypothetical protein [Spirochaetota bacterium]
MGVSLQPVSVNILQAGKISAVSEKRNVSVRAGLSTTDIPSFVKLMRHVPVSIPDAIKKNPLYAEIKICNKKISFTAKLCHRIPAFPDNIYVDTGGKL